MTSALDLDPDGASANHRRWRCEYGPLSTETEGLTEVGSPSVVRLRDGDSFDLRISAVRKQLGSDGLRMLAYNGSIPGPTLHVDQGSHVPWR